MADRVNTTVEALETGYVEGLKFQIESKELSKIMVARAEHHESRAKTKEAEIPNLEKSFEAIKAAKPTAVSGKGGSYRADPEELLNQLQEDIKNHQNRAVALRFISAHVIPDKKYILTESDLRSLEIVK